MHPIFLPSVSGTINITQKVGYLQSFWNKWPCGSKLVEWNSSSFRLRQPDHLVKLRHTVVSHQFNSEACRFWPFLPAWHRESLICMRPVSSVGPQTEAAHSLRSWGDQIGLPTHISHNLLRQDHPPGRAEMDTAIYNSHAEERGRMEGCGTKEESREPWLGKESHCCKRGNNVT